MGKTALTIKKNCFEKSKEPEKIKSKKVYSPNMSKKKSCF